MIEIWEEDVPDLPVSLDGVEVDTVTTGVIEPRAPTDRFPRPVPIGVSGGLSGIATGTLGVRVTDGTDVYVLSNNHVLAGVNTATIGDPIISPATRTAAMIQLTVSRRSRRTRRSTSAAARTPWMRRSR